jgi:hypothetical protein
MSSVRTLNRARPPTTLGIWQTVSRSASIRRSPTMVTMPDAVSLASCTGRNLVIAMPSTIPRDATTPIL